MQPPRGPPQERLLQRLLADLIPPNLRYSLHVNLIQHGREVCRSQAPLCGQCELKNFCSHYRQTESARVLSTDAPTVIDLFAGAGGFSEGFSRAGFKILAAVEMDAMAARTYRLNHPAVPDDRVLAADIRTLPPPPSPLRGRGAGGEGDESPPPLAPRPSGERGWG